MNIDFDALDKLISEAKTKLGMAYQQNKINIWTCKSCRMPHICIDRDDGVTPFMIGCRVTPYCKGMAESALYRIRKDTLLKPQFEWYRPKRGETFEGMNNPAVIEHIIHGGLLIREIKL